MMMMMLISMIIMMKQAKHFPFSKTNICKCSQQTFYLAKRMRETEARQLWVVLGGKGGGVLLVGGGRKFRANKHTITVTVVFVSPLLCALQTKLPILTHRPLPLKDPTPWALWPSHSHSPMLSPFPFPFPPTTADRSRAIVCVNKHFTIQHKLFLVLVVAVVVVLLPISLG